MEPAFLLPIPAARIIIGGYWRRAQKPAFGYWEADTMLTIWGPGRGPFCDRVTRRNFLTVGTLALGGLSLADLLRQKARGAVSPAAPKSVIIVYFPGGPSHIDLYDMKP